MPNALDGQPFHPLLGGYGTVNVQKMRLVRVARYFVSEMTGSDPEPALRLFWTPGD